MEDGVGGKVCHVKQRGKVVGFGLENLQEKDGLEDLGVDEKITLNNTLKTEDDQVWTEFN